MKTATQKLPNTIAKRLILYVVLFSSLITLIATGLQLFFDYKRDVNLINHRLLQVQNIHLKSLSTSLWAADKESLKIHVEGILEMPDIQYLEVKANQQVWAAAGKANVTNSITKTYQMTYIHRGRVVPIGSLKVIASLDEVYTRLFDKAIMILVSNGIKTFLVAGFMLMIFYYLVTRRLSRIASYVDKLGIDNLDDAIDLRASRRSPAEKDEFDIVAESFKRMQINIKNSLQQKAESELRFRQIAENINEVFWLVSPDTDEMIYVSPAYETIWGRSRESLYESPTNWTEAVHADDRERVVDAFARILQQDYDQVYRIIRPDNETRWIRDRGFCIYDEDNNVTRIAGLAEDITMQKHAEIRLNRHKIELQEQVEERTRELKDAHEQIVKKEKLATLGQLTAIVSHELRNPLGTIRTTLYNMKNVLQDVPANLDTPIARIERNVTRCDNIITEMLDFSREHIPNITSVNADEWLQEIVGEQRQPEGITVVKSWNANVLIALDSERMRRAVINLYDNACQAFSSDAEHASDDPEVEIKSSVQDDRLVVSISDNGPGIAEKDREKIFEPLYSTKGFGVGLGLPIVRQIIEEHHGRITLENRKPQGTVATIWIPLHLQNQNKELRALEV